MTTQQKTTTDEATPEDLLKCQISPMDVINEMKARFPVEFELCQMRAADKALSEQAQRVVAELQTQIAQLKAVDMTAEIVQNSTTA